MAYIFETTTKLTSTELDAAAALTAAGFGRENDDANYRDTREHLTGMDAVQLARDGERLAAFAAYRRQLWRASN